MRESSKASSRRRKIQEELTQRVRCNEEAWKLQQELLLPGAPEQLMEAALRLLPADEYEAVMEERALEGVCAFPPCSRPTAIAVAPQRTQKRWIIDLLRHEVHDQHAAGRFCCRECMRQNQQFSLRLQPDPAYCRPASAIQASRKALGFTASGILQDSVPGQAKGVESLETCQVASATPPQQQLLQQQPQQQQQLQVDSCRGPTRRNLPGVRRQAVVRFSRVAQTYTVQYGEEVSVAGQSHGNGERIDETPVACPKPSQNISESAGLLVGTDTAAEQDEENATRALDSGNDFSTAPQSKATVDGQTHCNESDSSEDDNFFDADTPHPVAWSGSPFVRAWGVLTNWLSDVALAVIRGARVELDDDGRPGHKARRDLLAEILSERLPGELTFLAPRFHEVIAALSLHQTLPSVTESQLYDLLAALILFAIYEGDAKRGLLAFSSSAPLVEQQVRLAAQRLKISDSDLQALQALFA